MITRSVKIRKSGGGQTIIIPKDMEVEGEKVYVKKIGRSLMIIPLDDPWKDFLESTEMFTEDFMENRTQPSQERESFE